MAMKLITDIDQHEKEITTAIRQSSRIEIAVAFLKVSGLSIIMDSLVDAAKRNCQINIVCGLDFGQTEPKALKQLYRLSKIYPAVKLYLASPSKSTQIFHPKFYAFYLKDKIILIGGSANLTSGGLQNNYEFSILCRLPASGAEATDVERYFKSITGSDFCREASMLRILEYQRFYDTQRAPRKAIRAKPLVSYKSIPFNFEKLRSYYRAYKRNNDIEQIFVDKEQHYRKAKKVLDKIADHPTLSKEVFTDLYEQLVGSTMHHQLWHSNGINRLKTYVFDYYSEFQELVCFIREHKNKRPSYVFGEAKRMVSDIEGAGINTVAEIMMTYNRKEFANLNANPIKALREGADVPLKGYGNSFNGIDYEDYCLLIKDICAIFDLRNMLEADSFFNDIFQKMKNILREK